MLDQIVFGGAQVREGKKKKRETKNGSAILPLIPAAYGSYHNEGEEKGKLQP